jgi:hypothetical protein
MRKRVGVLAIAAGTILVPIASPAAADAATQVGNTCTANEAIKNLTAVQLSKGPGGPPLTVPQAGVITSWSTNVIPFTGSLGQQMRVFRPTANPSALQVVGESEPAAVVAGANTFATRVPVQAGDRVGLGPAGGGSFPAGALLCGGTGNALDVAGIFEGVPPAGSTVSFTPTPEFQVAVAATVEPDADHDGFGDETQDKCPQSATTQAACPSVTIDAFSIKGKDSVTVLVAVSSQVPVSVTGTVKLGKGKSAKLKAPAQTLSAGPIGKFKLKFPGPLKSRLKELDHGQSLQLKVSAQATNVAGTISADNLKVKLKGEG